MTTFRLLDAFCCAGGASVGYHLAGFDVDGVDIRPQKHYPFRFYQADAIAFVREYGHMYDAIHASPPCQHDTCLRHLSGKEYVDLVGATRAVLEEVGKPWIIENVYGADLRWPVLLCGSMFGLGAWCLDGQWRQLRRHRLFECSFPVLTPACQHRGQPVGNYGNGGYRDRTIVKGINAYVGTMPERRAAMGIGWTNRYELSQAIPPAYTSYIGAQLMAILIRRGDESGEGENARPVGGTAGAADLRPPASGGCADRGAGERGGVSGPVREVPPTGDVRNRSAGPSSSVAAAGGDAV